MVKNYFIISNNNYLHIALKEVLSTVSVRDLGCDGYVVIIDPGSLTEKNTITLPLPTCHVVVLVPQNSKINFASHMNADMPITFLPLRAEFGFYLAAFNNLLLEIRRRMGCVFWESPYINKCFTKKQLQIFNHFITGESSIKVAHILQMPHKSIQNYFSAVAKKTCHRLDIQHLNFLRFCREWGSLSDLYKENLAEKTDVIQCPTGGVMKKN